MIDKRAVHQMYLISHSVSESMHVLLTPFPGWNPGLTEINSKTSINFTGARISPCVSLRTPQWWRSCQGFISSSQISQGVLEELHNFIQETGIFSPFGSVPSKYIGISAEMTNKLDLRGTVIREDLLGHQVQSFLIQAAVPGNIFIELPEFHLKPTGFPIPSVGRLWALFCWYIGTSILFLASWIHRQLYMDE